MDGVFEELSPKVVSGILKELKVCPDPSMRNAERWLLDLEEQLLLFKNQRQQAEEDDQDEEDDCLIAAVSTEDLRYFECLSHLLWWTLCSAVSFFSGDYPRQTAAEAFVPGQKNFDDFLCLTPMHCYEDDANELAHNLCAVLTAYDSHESVHKASFPDEEAESAEETRENMVDLFRGIIDEKRDAVDTETLAQQLELGCNLYASMIATVESSRDDLSMRRWRECYLTKAKQVAEWLRSANQSLIWKRANAEPNYALLVPFTKRADLFDKRREALQQQVQASLISAKKIFEVEHDHSQIESDFQCPKCGSFKTRSYHLQMSSADESMAQLWKCWNCKKSGKKE